jgi:MFS family permease
MSGSREAEPTFRDGMHYALGRAEPRSLLMLAATLSIFGLGAALAMLPVFAREALGLGASGYGSLMAAVGVGAGAGAITMAATGHRMDRYKVIQSATFLFGLSLLLCVARTSFPLALISLAVAGFGSVLAAISTNSLLQTEAPDQLRGRVMGFYSFVVLGLAPFGSLQAGLVSEHFGVRTCFVAGAIVCAAAAAWLAPLRARL